MKSGDVDDTRAFASVIENLEQLGWYHSIALPSGAVIPGVQSIEHLQMRISQFQIAEDLTGKRVLDIGAWDGWFTFEMERRGATVVAIDLNAGTNFRRASQMVGSRAEHHILDILDLTPEAFGQFDIVMCFGVLYHLKHPLLAIEKLYEMSSDLVLIESYVSECEHADSPPRMEFYETTELCGQFDNWTGPNIACLLAWCRSTGFAEVLFHSVLKDRAHVTCRKQWSRRALQPKDPAPYILAVQTATREDHSFGLARDEYISVWFESQSTDLNADSVFPEIGFIGIRPAAVSFSNGAWLANFKLPIGLARGWHFVSIRTRNSGRSNCIHIGVHAPEPDPLTLPDLVCQLLCVADNKTWERNRIRTGQGSSVAVWAAGAFEANASYRDFEFRLSGSSLPCVYASAPDAKGVLQLNALIPAGLPPGRRVLQLIYNRTVSAPVEIELVSVGNSRSGNSQ